MLEIRIRNWLAVFKPGTHVWFLKIVSVRMSVCVCVGVCVCSPPRLLITSGVMWRYMDPTRLVKQVRSTAVIWQL